MVEEVAEVVQLDGGNDDADGEHSDVDTNSVSLASMLNNFFSSSCLPLSVPFNVA